jgi:hypothetical protein
MVGVRSFFLSVNLLTPASYRYPDMNVQEKLRFIKNSGWIAVVAARAALFVASPVSSRWW